MEDLKAKLQRDDATAIQDIIEYLKVHDEAYLAELVRKLPSVGRIPAYRVRKLLGEAVSAGRLGTAMRSPPFGNDTRSRWQRRYYWNKK